MEAEFLKIGTKLEITSIPGEEEDVKDEGISYTSMIEEIFPNGDLEVDMPTYQRKLVLLHNGVRYQFYFYNGKTTYMAVGEVVDRYKTENRYFLRVQLKTQPVKFQRREYFRCECMIDLKYHPVPSKDYDMQEVMLLRRELMREDVLDILEEGIILDISGGGVRFVSKNHQEVGSYVRMIFRIPIYEGEYRMFDLIGKIISCDSIKDGRMNYVNRVKFICIESGEREEIIRFIFEEERKSRKLSRG
ncbi:c-di-GMP-binding flagellar brake protein YcgR, contains PilZNR and PilZ domains [Lachnospiraceae bacterium XBB1006]|nr:c-di-GMP-binding flagellar brake protein YcgR, contains PilZNR and PilZ domains [Lachnospiraceae bacterium XBB1006]